MCVRLVDHLPDQMVKLKDEDFNILWIPIVCHVRAENFKLFWDLNQDGGCDLLFSILYFPITNSFPSIKSYFTGFGHSESVASFVHVK